MSRRLPPLLLVLALGACATQTPPSSPPVVRTLPTQQAPQPALLAPVPQPPERPLAPPAVTDPAIPRDQRIAAFVDYTSRTYGVPAERIRSVLAQAQTIPRILEIMSRPAEAVKPWRDYRPIFLTDARINGGVAFYNANRDALERVSAQTGVPADVIVAIMGVETGYGGNMGSYRVLDAIYTLAFDYPKRAPFFAGELAQLFALQKAEPQLDITALKGSYAGAMGMGQFMPSSYRLWAMDGDGDGQRDLLTHKPDVFASIANYFVVHGWQRGAPVVARATLAPGREEFIPNNDPKALDPIYPLELLAQRGYQLLPGEPRADGAVPVHLDGAAGREIWLGYRNYYVITRYNRSPMYALAVHQLSQAIRAGVGTR